MSSFANAEISVQRPKMSASGFFSHNQLLSVSWPCPLHLSGST